MLVNGKEERHPEGAYYLEWRERTKRVRLSVGKDPVDASARRLRKEAELNAANHGVTVRPEDGQNGHRSVAAAIADFLDETKLTKSPRPWPRTLPRLPIFRSPVLRCTSAISSAATS